MFKTLPLRNWSVIEIVANISVLVLSLYFFETHTLLATLLVTGVFIAVNTISLKKSIKNKVFTGHPYLMANDLNESLIILGELLYCGIRSFVYIKSVSAIQYVVTNPIEIVSEALSNNLISILINGLITIPFIVYGISRHYDQIRNSHIEDHVAYYVDKYQLDLKHTYFFTRKNQITCFVIGHYKFDLYEGLIVGNRSYKFSLLKDYLNIAGIGFHELDDGHIKNIEMYGISG